MSPTQHNATNSSGLNERFVFDCEHFQQFCQRFNETPIETQSESLLEIKSKDLEARWAKVEQSYENVMLASLSDIDAEAKETARITFDECVETYYHLNSEIKESLRTFTVGATQSYGLASTANSGPFPGLSQPFPQNNLDCIKLPPCDTEIFKGSYEQWPSFRDMFTAVYINHSKLTPVTKLYHLRNKTRGEAGAIVTRFPLSHDNFALAWDALKTRYENKRVLVDNQIKNLFNILAIKDEDSESIRKIQSSVNDALASLRTLGIDTTSWDPILIRLVSTKLPEVTLSLYEQSLISPRELPEWSHMSQFLVDRCEALERLTNIKTAKECFNPPNSRQPKMQTYMAQEKISESTCKLCNSNHSLRTCQKFRGLTVQQRADYVFKNKYCNNCLAASHLKANCGSKNTCLYCKKTHHTLLHMKLAPNTLPQSIHNKKEVSNEKQNSAHVSFARNLQSNGTDACGELPKTSNQVQANCSMSSENILLRTACMQIEYEGQLFNIRALIDPGSQRTFITERIRSRLQIPYKKSQFEIVGIGGQQQVATKECALVLYAKRYDLRIPIRAIVLPRVTKRLPACTFEIPYSRELEGMDLADPNFNKSSHIDLILGNDYEQLINIDGIQKNICGLTSAYNTVFGWVLSGPIKSQVIQAFTTSIQVSETQDLNNLLRKFWEQEELPIVRTKSIEDEFCENYYTETTTRQEDGRYMVRLPFKSEFPDSIFLGASRYIALAQYARTEKSLAKNPELQSQYQAVLDEYLTLDHMEETSAQELVSQGNYFSYYLPHHAIVRPDHKTTKVRVVFNASRKTNSQFSLNDALHIGPTMQSDLMTIILNWRKYRFVFNGDIQKMYRQILIHPSDRQYQRILFQSQPNGTIADYQLKTVTFGVNAAPYLAIRTLLQLATDSATLYPKASSILRTETYVDDILSGGYTIEEAQEAQHQLIQSLKSAGFPLKKITANDPRLLAHLPKEDLYDADFLIFHGASSTKTLGIKWNAMHDSFTYSFSPIEQASKITKRQILSSVAKLFDPAGWLAPIIIRAKILMQQLWLEGLQWDEEVSQDSREKWNSLAQDIAEINTITISRWLQYTPQDDVQIHGFSDASKAAYCAAVYIRCQTSSYTIFTNLLVAKSRVAPIQTVSLPRLELNGAVLLANLVNHVSLSLNLNVKGIYLWTDSSIVLGWLSKPPSSWETYVANRTAQIHRLVPNTNWRHVPTHDNPADLGTRGSKPKELSQNLLWWYGPNWLYKPSSEWPKRNPFERVREPIETISLHTEAEVTDLLVQFSAYDRSLRVMCYIFRFFYRCLKHSRRNVPNNCGSLTQSEMIFVKTRLITLAQKSFYPEEYQCLHNSQALPTKSPLRTLNPFLDSDGRMRVNGRLAQSSLPYSERYPIILPGNSQFAALYLAHLHTFLAHAECRHMCRMVQTEFYISRLKPRIRSIVRRCKTCIIYRQQASSQLMAPLPPERCNFSPPFHITGIDFAGPFEIKSSPLRKSPTLKAYVSVFVCFSVKAIHLEVCSDLSSAAFQAAFARFVARRGLPKMVKSDNGKNFLGASRALELEFREFVGQVAEDISQKYLAHGFEWKFIPPHAPHMGGLWEAAVKSFKFHLKRVAGSQRFTFEEFTTVLTRIEGILNSRPISAVSNEPDDLTALTPGHFLRGSPIMALPEDSMENMSLTDRWERLKVLHHQFAKRWKEDYLKALHKRYKWKSVTPNLEEGNLVVIMDDALPPHEWRLGRIVNTYPGADGHVRIAEVKTATGVVTRPAVKLCYLPLLESESSQ